MTELGAPSPDYASHSTPPHWLQVAVALPAHSAATADLGGLLTYQSDVVVALGQLVRVPLGTRTVTGVAWGEADAPSGDDRDRTRAVAEVLPLPPLGAAWRRLVQFSARYYQRHIGELALAVLPSAVRDLTGEQWARRLKPPKTQKTPKAPTRAKNATKIIANDAETLVAPEAAVDDLPDLADLPVLSTEQSAALAHIHSQPGPFLLFGATGSGKTEVYLRAVADALAADPAAQALVMVPEINLTPQLEARFAARFAPLYGDGAVVSQHSGLTPPQRLKAWLAAHTGAARIVLGTRMAVFASMPGLKLIVVDEEHDASYKQQDGARYSARDLALYRGQREGAKVILGSATPSLETWHASRPADATTGDAGGRIQRLAMPSRVGEHLRWPTLRRIDMNTMPRGTVFAPQLLAAIQATVARGEQAMLLLNRRGYAPVLACKACDWKSDCPHCSAHQVFHKIDRTLRCHHCGHTQRVPRACPSCGNVDIAPLGRGTEQLEEQLTALLAGHTRPDGQPLVVARIDADTTRKKGELEAQLAAVHRGDVDVLVGTQMIAKGHDFRRITLVAAINPDGALFSADFRAPERLFALLMQAAGRAGRDAAHSGHSEVWIQTHHPQHPLMAALKAHDYPGFAAQQLQEREDAGLPPFSHQALLRADARTQDAAQAFLNAAREAVQADAAWADWIAAVTLYPAVPLTVQRVANVERAQMLIESDDRAVLQQFLSAWQAVLHSLRADPAHKGVIRWLLDVDPLAI